MSGADYSRTCEGCEHIVAEPWTKDAFAYRCFAPGKCRGYIYKKDGNGYCCMVERSKTQREKVRRPDMERCELYKPGDFNTRYRTEVNE